MTLRNLYIRILVVSILLAAASACSGTRDVESPTATALTATKTGETPTATALASVQPTAAVTRSPAPIPTAAPSAAATPTGVRIPTRVPSAFYRGVTDAARQRGFKVLIETSCIFANSPFTDVQFDFSKLTPAAYFQARTDEIVTIARELRPDFLALGEEPVNERVFAGINYTPAEYVDFINSAAAAVRKELGANASRVKLGVGTGTWEFDLFQRFIQQTDLDFYDIHIYPLQGNPGGLATAREMARLARRKGKPAIIGETWLYKMAQSEIGATASEAFRRDAFTFWAPLEIRYIGDVLALGAEFRMPFVSFWGARFFFGQVDWTPQLDALDFRGISSTVNPIITQNLAQGRRTAFGDAFARVMGR